MKEWKKEGFGLFGMLILVVFRSFGLFSIVDPSNRIHILFSFFISFQITQEPIFKGKGGGGWRDREAGTVFTPEFLLLLFRIAILSSSYLFFACLVFSDLLFSLSYYATPDSQVTSSSPSRN